MFEVISITQQNPCYDPERANNGGGYYQPLYKFVYNGIEGKFEDTSCGDFGGRYHLEWNGLHANRDQVGNECNYSEFSRREHAELLDELYNLTGWRIRTKEDYAEMRAETFDEIFCSDIDFSRTLSGDFILDKIEYIQNRLASKDYTYWLDDEIKVNPYAHYELWLDQSSRLWGLRKIS